MTLDPLATSIYNQFTSAFDAETITITVSPEEVGTRSLMFWHFADGVQLSKLIKRDLLKRPAVKEVVVCFPNGEAPMSITRRRKRAQSAAA